MIALCQVNPAGPWFGPRDGVRRDRCPAHHRAEGPGAEVAAHRWGVRLWADCDARGARR